MTSATKSVLLLTILFSVSSPAITIVAKVNKTLEATYTRLTVNQPYREIESRSKAEETTSIEGIPGSKTALRDLIPDARNRIGLNKAEDNQFYITQSAEIEKNHSLGIEIQVEFTSGTTWEDYLDGKRVSVKATPAGEVAFAKFDGQLYFEGTKLVFRMLDHFDVSDIESTDGLNFEANLDNVEVRSSGFSYTVTMNN